MPIIRSPDMYDEQLELMRGGDNLDELLSSNSGGRIDMKNMKDLLRAHPDLAYILKSDLTKRDPIANERAYAVGKIFAKRKTKKSGKKTGKKGAKKGGKKTGSCNKY